MLIFLGCKRSDLPDKPNVIVILTDDQGYGDVGYLGNPRIKTPTIDSLALSGIQFTQFYVSPRCAPTRAALMTGRHPEKTGVFHVTDGGYIMAAQEITMAEYFKKAGYKTGIFGKWHIGDHYPYMPSDQGFDFSLIHKGGAIGQIADHSNNYWDMTRPLEERKSCYFNTTLYKNREIFQAEGYITDVLTDHTIQFIENTRNQPFFIYLSFNIPHDPYQVPEDYLGLYRDLPFHPAMDSTNGNPYRLNDYEAARYVYGMMTNMDDNLSRLMNALRKHGLARNTIIMYLSDNGPAQYRYNANFRGKKGQLFEGGIRVPAFLNHKGLHPRKVTFPAAHYDILPTLAGLCDLELPDNIDGIDLLKEGKEKSERPVFIRESSYLEPYKDMMIRKGDFKLIASGDITDPDFKLFNISSDPYEEFDLVLDNPVIVRELKSELDHWYNEIIRSENLRIHPVIIGSDFENPVRLSRHELISSYSHGWFSKNYLGYYPLKINDTGFYNIKLSFRDTLVNTGRVELKIGPTGRSKVIGQKPVTELEFSEIFLQNGEYVLQSWYQDQDEVISPFYIYINKE